ncbi:phosphate-selective porin OprO/OprP [Catalinimonas alkaloidigena]|uniref:OprO/OprP family phosphate-selective porin n=1 Tax=Catalinimonas alkaloidigena TaxID=1075417 RepID=UPI002404B0F1|nr:porin [Catalinimonas alkaloidigena]MDF9798572.1 phosphate-selective porin OprO/OprP [Catalinimonas alkaloidigena]
MIIKLCTSLVCAFCVCTFHAALAFQDKGSLEKDSLATQIEYTSKGFQFTAPNNKFQLQIGGRLQFRFATPNDQDPITFADFDPERKTVFKINRARLKVGGHTFHPWLRYYFEYELGASRLLDFRFMIEKWPWLSFKLGQWKTEYTRERVISSGNQQMMERSIINRPFTVDRQQGISVYGHIQMSKVADFNYNLAVLTGTGINARVNDDENLMYTARVQWNFLGEAVPMIGSDLEVREEPLASVAVAGVTNRSRYTRFSSSGGGNLTDFEIGEAGQYSVNQWLFETAFMYRSFSWHSEMHLKNIDDHINQTFTQLRGGFWQAGYVLNHEAATTKPLFEPAFRYAIFQPSIGFPQYAREEFSLALNCFFSRHANKLTADVTYFEFEEGEVDTSHQSWRFRVQYEVSF